jgi:hypothetical protein
MNRAWIGPGQEMPTPNTAAPAANAGRPGTSSNTDSPVIVSVTLAAMARSRETRSESRPASG